MGAERFWRNVVFGNDGRPSADLNGCTIHRNVCDLVRWPDGSKECMICARDRQSEASMPNPAYHMRPMWEWTAPPPRWSRPMRDALITMAIVAAASVSAYTAVHYAAHVAAVQEWEARRGAVAGFLNGLRRDVGDE
jgi:hypothetical protein